MRFAIVLGAGGPKAWPFHAGVLRQLAESDLAPAGAELIIGTSAGSAVGTATRYGATPDEIIRFITTPPSGPELAAYGRSFPQGHRARLRASLPRAPRLLLDALPGGRGVGLAAAGVLPAGIMPTDLLARLPRVSADAPMPDGLWVPAIRLPDGERVVFGRDVTVADTRAVEAVQASSAVPWLFQAKRVDDASFVDGAIDSPTHADLALDIEPDLVIVSSVMTRPGNRPAQLLARRALQEEVDRLRQAGVRTVVVGVDLEIASLLEGFPRRNPDCGPAIADLAARLTERALLA